MDTNEKTSSPQAPSHPNPLSGNRNEYCTPNAVGSDIYDNTPPASEPPSSSVPPYRQPSSAFGNALARHSATIMKTLLPFHHLAYKIGSESPLPQDMQAEIQKATRILQAFTTDPSHPLEPLPRPHPTPRVEPQEQGQATAAEGARKNHTLLPIPASVLAGAVALAIFTSARIGFHASLSTGSGILIARLPDGSWGPPSCISVHAIGAGLLAGMDMSDVVCVINTEDALEAFTRTKVTLGSEVAVAAGPWGAGGGVGVVMEGCSIKKGQHAPQTHQDETPDVEDDMVREKMTREEIKEMDKEKKRSARDARRAAAHAAVRTALKRPVYTYVRSRGLYAGLQVDGTIITERSDANTSFYGMSMPAKQILNGYVPPGRWIETAGGLYHVLAGIESRAPRLPSRPTGFVDGREEQTQLALTSSNPAKEADRKENVYSGIEGDRRISVHEEEWEELPRYEDNCNGAVRPQVEDIKEGSH